MPHKSSMFKFLKPDDKLTKMCKSKGYDPEHICLSNSDVYWHKKDWVKSNNKVPVNLSSYSIVKRRR